MVKPFSAVSLAGTISQPNPLVVGIAGHIARREIKDEKSKAAEGTLENGFRSLLERKAEEIKNCPTIDFYDLLATLKTNPQQVAVLNLKFIDRYVELPIIAERIITVD
ncbi:MAG: hypothetical protein NZT61_05585 [Deltaproteobacteria bacterium]|nr:hypothetical protein [Deltaproteobacteria bacterium]MCX7953358.1 hypothetical protein [Deltaproteobacteria bacterium]